MPELWLKGKTAFVECEPSGPLNVRVCLNVGGKKRGGDSDVCRSAGLEVSKSSLTSAYKTYLLSYQH